ncbi:MAG: class I tRNA ligase family protein, partial [Rhodobacteraceae bacterium]|nr:class I tRNA ligase family protein [Paracoccaceae bacterium]
YIGQMKAMIQTLIDKGHAYEAEGHVLFDVNSYGAYGNLSGRKLADMRAGERVAVAECKRDPMDFVLWKPSTGDQPGWESPWGYGRPGWHIECSAMSLDLLGESFDIHAGGLDLQFPHHENEIAQSCCANPTGKFANYWLHNEMLQVEGKKMSKSLGNFFTVKDLLDKGVPGEVIRFVLLSTHYRSPMDWTEKKVKEAEATLRDWLDHLKSSHLHFSDQNWPIYLNDKTYEADPEVISALCDDLNTHGAITRMHKLAKSNDIASINALLGSMILLGFLSNKTDIDLLSFSGISWIGEYPHDLERTILSLLERRQEARRQKDFALSDNIRDGLIAAGINVTDSPDGPEWSIGANFDLSKLEGLQ